MEMDGFGSPTRGSLPYFGPLQARAGSTTDTQYMARPRLKHLLGADRCQSLTCLPTAPVFRCSVTLCLARPASAGSPEPAAWAGEAFRAQFVLFPQCNLTSR